MLRKIISTVSQPEVIATVAVAGAAVLAGSVLISDMKKRTDIEKCFEEAQKNVDTIVMDSDVGYEDCDRNE